MTANTMSNANENNVATQNFNGVQTNDNNGDVSQSVNEGESSQQNGETQSELSTLEQSQLTGASDYSSQQGNLSSLKTSEGSMTNGVNTTNDSEDDVPWAERLQKEGSSQIEAHVSNNEDHDDDSTPWSEKIAGTTKSDNIAKENNGEDNKLLPDVKVKKEPVTPEDHNKKGKGENLNKEKSKEKTKDKSKKLNNAVDQPLKTEAEETKVKDSSKKKNKIEEPIKSSKAKAKIKEETPEPQPKKKKHSTSESSTSNKKKPKVEVKKEETPEPHEKTGKKRKNEEEAQTSSPKKRKKGQEEEEVWKWWEEEKREDGVKWKSLEHKGPIFAPPYIPLPDNVKFKYDGEEMKLSEEAEEVATFYAKMLDHDYTQKSIFNKNFMHDWRKVMTSSEKSTIKDLSKCDFKEIYEYFKVESEKRKARSKEEKKAELEVKKKEAEEFGVAVIDGHKQKIANFRIEPPGLFRGRGDHPKMGCLKRRVMPEDVTINCSKGVKISPPPGTKWQGVVHDNTVTWLATWVENVLNSNKYIMLNPSSKLKGEKDWEKFETARRLKSIVGEIRENYQADFKSHEMRIRQRAVALYFIDKLALRAGNEKDTEEAADTVGCCSLRCEHIKMFDELDDQKHVVEFDFLGKDSIRYYNKVPVEKSVYKNLKKFMDGKAASDDLFDRLDTSSLNEHLRSLMPGLTAKVFRTYNASITLQDQLDKITRPDDSIPEKLLAYNRANRQVAILCNHQRAVPKTFEKSMENLQNKIKDKKSEVKTAKAELKAAKGKDQEKLEKRVARLKEQLKKLKVQQVDKDENKQIALGTSKLNYMDPRFTVAWCKRNDVPVEKIFTKTHREKFRWAIDMADEDFVF